MSYLIVAWLIGFFCFVIVVALLLLVYFIFSQTDTPILQQQVKYRLQTLLN